VHLRHHPNCCPQRDPPSSKAGIRFPVSRADIAALTAEQVDDDAYLRRAPAISN
jgi:hypothetical protein